MGTKDNETQSNQTIECDKVENNCWIWAILCFETIRTTIFILKSKKNQQTMRKTVNNSKESIIQEQKALSKLFYK